MKKILVLNLLAIFSVATVAANNQKAIEYFMYDLNGPAKKILLGNLKSGGMSSQEQAEANYYLGEIYFSEQKKDSADYYFRQGINVDPNYILNTVGMAKASLKTDAPGAEKTLSGIASKNKKDVSIQYAVAKAYLDNGMVEKASKQVTEAKKSNTNAAPLFTLEGDILAKNNKHGEAATMYEQAIYFDSQSKEAYIKYARMYSHINLAASIQMLERLAAVDPASFLPYREIGEMYYQNGQYANAIKAYDKYISNEKYISDDYPKYITMLFFSGQFEKSFEMTQQALKTDPNNFALNRLLIYNEYELKKYPEGLAQANQFMKIPNKEFTALDYIYYARLLAENNEKEEAVVQYQKGLQTDSSRVIAYKELAEVYTSLEQYTDAIDAYQKFIADGGNQVKTIDHFSLGQAYYSLANEETTEETDRIKYATAADSVFAYIAEKVPNSYLGNFWRARANAVLDPESEQGLAKPYYEATIPLLDKESSRDARLLIECYRYLGYYYFLKRDIPTSKTYWNKILEIDPANETALKALKEI